MYYGTTTLGIPIPPAGRRGRIVRALLWFVPPANPNHEPLYPRVARWLLEVDEDGHPFREIGLDASGAPLFGAPNKQNFGFFTDSNATFARKDLVAVERSEFEKVWLQVNGK